MKWRKAWPLLVGTALAAIWIVSQASPPQKTRTSDEQTIVVAAPTVSPRDIAKPHLALADRRIQDATKSHFGGISSLFAQARTHTDEFAKSALGWGSKWRIATDAMPFTKGNRNEEYLKEQFEKQVLSGAKLEKAIEQCVIEFLDDIHSIESKMLVDLKADLAGLPGNYNISQMSEEELQSHFDAAIQNAMQVAGVDLQSNISSQLVSIVVGEVLTQLAVRMGVSAGILGTGAASGWATLGIGVVVGIVIDQIVMSIWNQWSNPKGNLVDTLNHQLDVMQAVICLGDDETQGLKQRFEQIANTRAEVRQAAVLELLEASVPPTAQKVKTDGGSR